MTSEDDGVTVVLHRMPGCFALPTLDPRALALETLLRLCDVRFTKVVSPPAQLGLSLSSRRDVTCEQRGQRRADTRPATAATTTTRLHGLANCVQYVCESVDRDVAPAFATPPRLTTRLSDAQSTALACVEALARHCVFPAFTFVVYADDVLYGRAVCKSVVPRVASLWQTLTRRFRRDALRDNVYAHGGGGDDAAAACVRTAVADATRALHALAQLHAQHARDASMYFLGTAQPTVADAYAYAAVSCLVHADFVSCCCDDGDDGGNADGRMGSGHTSACAALLQLQRDVREACPLLVQYAERLRHVLYDEYSGTYHLRSLPPPSSSLPYTAEASGGGPAAAMTGSEDVYRAGRARTLWLTALFACVYFVCANHQSVLSLLLLLAGGADDGVSSDDGDDDDAQRHHDNDNGDDKTPVQREEQ